MVANAPASGGAVDSTGWRVGVRFDGVAVSVGCTADVGGGADVGCAVNVGEGVNVGDGVSVGDGVNVDGAAVVGTGVGEEVTVAVQVAVQVAVGEAVGEAVQVAVGVAVGDGVKVGVGGTVFVGRGDGVDVAVGVGVCVGVAAPLEEDPRDPPGGGGTGDWPADWLVAVGVGEAAWAGPSCAGPIPRPAAKTITIARRAIERQTGPHMAAIVRNPSLSCQAENG